MSVAEPPPVRPLLATLAAGPLIADGPAVTSHAKPSADHQPADQEREQRDERLLAIPGYRRLLAVQVLFWSSSATFLMLPKYFAVTFAAGAGWIGVTMGALAVGAVLAAPAIGPLARRWGRRRCMVGGCLLLALGALLFIPVAGPGPLAVAARVLQGVATALLAAHGSVLVADLVPPARLPSAIALYMTAGLLSNVISPPLAEWLIFSHGPTWAFAGAALLALGAAALALRLPPVSGAQPAHPAASRPLAARPTAALLLVSALFGLAGGAVFAFHQPLALERGALRVSDFLIAFTATAAVLRLGGGPLLDRLGSARVACWSAFAYAAVLVAMAWMGGGGLVLFGILIGASHGIFFPAFIATALTGGGSGRETRMAWIGASDKLGYLMIIPAGLLAERCGYAAVFVLVGLLAGGAALVLLRQFRAAAEGA